MAPGPLKEFVCPPNFTSLVRQFHYRWYFKNARFPRFLVYSYILCLPVFWAIDNAVHSPGNIQEWKERRAARYHTHFDPPQE